METRIVRWPKTTIFQQCYKSVRLRYTAKVSKISAGVSKRYIFSICFSLCLLLFYIETSNITLLYDDQRFFCFQCKCSLWVMLWTHKAALLPLVSLGIDYISSPRVSQELPKPCPWFDPGINHVPTLASEPPCNMFSSLDNLVMAIRWALLPFYRIMWDSRVRYYRVIGISLKANKVELKMCFAFCIAHAVFSCVQSK